MGKWFGKSICKHKVAWAVDNLEGFVVNTFVNEMMVNIDVFCTLVMTCLLQEVHCAAVIEINCCQNIFQICKSELDQQTKHLASCNRPLYSPSVDDAAVGNQRIVTHGLSRLHNLPINIYCA